MEKITQEVWKEVEGFEEFYKVSNLGRVQSLDRYVERIWGPVLKYGIILENQYTKKLTRAHVILYAKKGVKVKKPVARLVYETFVGKLKTNELVVLKDGNKLNCRLDNIQIVKPGQILEDGNEFLKKGVNQYDQQGNFIKSFASLSAASREIGKQVSQIISCCKGKNKTVGGFVWKYKEN